MKYLTEDEILPFLEYKVYKNLPFLLSDNFEKTHKNIINYVSLILENAPIQSHKTKDNKTNNEKKNISSPTPSTQPTGPAQLSSSDDIKKTAIGTGAVVAGFGVRQLGINKGYFHGLTDVKLSNLSPEEKAKVIDKVGGEGTFSGAKFTDGNNVTISAKDYNTKVAGSLSDSADVSHGTDLMNAAGGTVTGMVAAMGVRLAANAIQSKLKKRKEAKEKLKNNLNESINIRNVGTWIKNNAFYVTFFSILFLVMGARLLVSYILQNSQPNINPMDDDIIRKLLKINEYKNENGQTINLDIKIDGLTAMEYIRETLQSLTKLYPENIEKIKYYIDQDKLLSDAINKTNTILLLKK